MELTPKQEKFCQCIVSGMSGKDSYLTAYNCNSDRVAYNESNVLLKRDDITKRIQELMKPVQNHSQNIAISEREKKRKWLWHMIENATNDSDRIRAMDILNKMDSEYINYTRDLTTQETNITQLPTETLMELSKAN